MPPKNQAWYAVSGNTVAGMTMNTLGGFLSGGPGGRSIDQSLNVACMNQIPSMDGLIQMYFTGYLDKTQLNTFAGQHGVDLSGGQFGTCGPQYEKLWNGYISSQWWRPDASFVFGAMQRELISDVDKAEVMKRYRMDGNVLNRMIKAFQDQLPPGECLTLYNRQYLNDENITKYLVNYGGYSDEQIQAYSYLSRYIPPVGDLINMTVKGAFDDEQINRLELNAEIEETGTASDWAERQGIGFCRFYENGVQTDSIDWFSRYWYTHWVNAAPGQVLQFGQRFRPNRMFRYEKQVPGIKPFTANDVDFYLKVNDYTPPVRKWLAGLGLSLPRLVDTRNQYFYGIIDRQELIELQLDRGYTETDAETFAKLADKQKEVFKYKHRVELFDSFDRKLYNEIISAFRAGSISEQDFAATIFGILKDEAAADSVVKAELVRANTAVAKAAVAAIKSSFFTGEVSSAEADARLRQAGIDPSAVQRYMDVWELKMTMPRRVRTAGQLISDYANNTLGIGALANRLQNLGYSQRDVQLMLQEANRRKEQQQEKDQKREEKKKGKGGGGSTDAGERWLNPDRIGGWEKKGLITADEAKAMLLEIDVAPNLLPLFMGEPLNG